jgi:hypothetical protein
MRMAGTNGAGTRSTIKFSKTSRLSNAEPLGKVSVEMLRGALSSKREFAPVA